MLPPPCCCSFVRLDLGRSAAVRPSPVPPPPPVGWISTPLPLRSVISGEPLLTADWTGVFLPDLPTRFFVFFCSSGCLFSSASSDLVFWNLLGRRQPAQAVSEQVGCRVLIPCCSKENARLFFCWFILVAVGRIMLAWKPITCKAGISSAVAH